MTYTKKKILLVGVLLGIYTYTIVTYFTPWFAEKTYWTAFDYIHFKEASRTPINITDYIHSPLSPGLKWCSSNPFLDSYDRKTVFYMEHIWYKWSETQLQSVYDILTKVALSRNTTDGYITHMAYPEKTHLPCPNKYGLVRYGKSLGTGKVLCGIATIPPSAKCIIYSLGSNNNFEFEQAIIEQTSCQVHTYDCTSSPPKVPIKGLTFHNVCMGEQTNLQQHIFPYSVRKEKLYNNETVIFKRFSQIVQENNHDHVHVLKMDIEGAEYGVFADIFNSSKGINLPFQISFESHWWYHDFYHAILHQHMFNQLWKKGYRFLYHELNPGDPSCVEWTLMRVFC
ncbi:unnamed protein product [Adineta steineri]|uniref:Methyltransferase domain-containing protein n=1 Tax=Adineta steineri TaxID=433720 RepID=A0A819IGM5_9BILA|nr:unnamed protein product [Adineta steineri]CAF3790243.1 unnamed protein product [Adineta steineri]CAF3916200.1 unnamed protein product [Adineta steineri]